MPFLLQYLSSPSCTGQTLAALLSGKVTVSGARGVDMSLSLFLRCKAHSKCKRCKFTRPLDNKPMFFTAHCVVCFTEGHPVLLLITDLPIPLQCRCCGCAQFIFKCSISEHLTHGRHQCTKTACDIRHPGFQILPDKSHVRGGLASLSPTLGHVAKTTIPAQVVYRNCFCSIDMLLFIFMHFF